MPGNVYCDYETCLCCQEVEETHERRERELLSQVSDARKQLAAQEQAATDAAKAARAAVADQRSEVAKVSQRQQEAAEQAVVRLRTQLAEAVGNEHALENNRIITPRHQLRHACGAANIQLQHKAIPRQRAFPLRAPEQQQVAEGQRDEAVAMATATRKELRRRLKAVAAAQAAANEAMRQRLEDLHRLAVQHTEHLDGMYMHH